jgi:hypothetical protein
MFRPPTNADECSAASPHVLICRRWPAGLVGQAIVFRGLPKGRRQKTIVCPTKIDKRGCVPDMPTVEAFCYFGLLRSRETLKQIASMLPDARRNAVLACIESSGAVADSELRKRLAAIRQAQGEELRRRLVVPEGVCLERLSPVLRRWLEAKAENDG